MKPKEFFKKWIQGIKDLTPTQQLQGKMVGHLGAAIGLSMAVIASVIRGSWIWAIVIIFFVWLQWIEFVGAKQRCETSKNTEESIKEQSENLKKILEKM